MFGIDVDEGDDIQRQIHERVSRLVISEMVDPVPHLDRGGKDDRSEERV